MRKVTLLLMTLVAVTHVAVGQVDVSAVNKPIELLNEANTDIEDGNYKDAVQKLIAANRLNPKLREVYSSLNTACTHTNQISLLKEFLVKGKGIFEEDDELCYYLGNIYQNQQNYAAAIKEYSLAIQYAKKNGLAGVDYGGMDTMPDIPGLMLWKEGHAGVYIGGGYAIEAMNTRKGVVKTEVAGRGWSGWCKLPYLDYMEDN